MKQQIIIFMAAILMIACTPTEYKISGKLDTPTVEGAKVYIKERIDRVWLNTDSTKIENGVFSFSGVCDSSRMVYLVFESSTGEAFRKPFVLENGKISINIDSLSKMTVVGTVQNELLSNYNSDKEAFYAKAREEYNKVEAEVAADPSKREALNATMEELTNKEISDDLHFAVKNVNSIVGTFVFTNTFHGMSIEQKEKVTSLMNTSTKSGTRVAEIVTAIEKEKKTTVGQMFTDIQLATASGEMLALSSLVGKTDYVMIDFWASWCGPCIQSFPELKELYNTHKGSKLAILGVSLDDNAENWKSAIEIYQLQWNHISDLKGWKSEGASLYAVNSIPATVLIDKQGKIVGRNLSISQIHKLLSE